MLSRQRRYIKSICLLPKILSTSCWKSSKHEGCSVIILSNKQFPIIFDHFVYGSSMVFPLTLCTRQKAPFAAKVFENRSGLVCVTSSTTILPARRIARFIYDCADMAGWQQRLAQEEAMPAQSPALESSPPSASHRYYHIIISPNSRNTLNQGDVGQNKDRLSMGRWKLATTSLSECERTVAAKTAQDRKGAGRGGRIVTKAALLLLLLWYQNPGTKVKYFSVCCGKRCGPGCSSWFGFLPLPFPSPLSPARCLSCHCGCGMLETQCTEREPKLNFPWHRCRIVGPGGRRAEAGSGDGARACAPTSSNLQ